MRTPCTAAAVATVLMTAAARADTLPPPDFSALAPAPLDAAAMPLSAAANAAMVAVPGGTYRIGRDDGPADEGPAHAVTIEGFRIDRTEVTNAAFAEYLNALNLPVPTELSFDMGSLRRSDSDAPVIDLLTEGGWEAGLYPIIGLDDEQVRIGFADGRFRATPGLEDHPVAETTWAGARAYCAWRGGRLPSEVEWEAAARGTDGRLYPWGGDAPDGTRAYTYPEIARTQAVGGLPAGASPVGALDMSGSMAEWTSTLKRPYPYDATDGREDPGPAGERVTRGGDYLYDDTPRTLTATFRDGFSNAPEDGHRHIGFRCVTSVGS